MQRKDDAMLLLKALSQGSSSDKAALSRGLKSSTSTSPAALAPCEGAALSKAVWAIKQASVSGLIDSKTISFALGPTVPKHLAIALCHAADVERNGHIDLGLFARVVATLCNSPAWLAL